MARIRTVKPEFWEDEGVGALSRDARLLFIGTWNLADDEGLLRWTADYLKAQVFAYDADMTIAKVTKLMGELEAGDFVFPYLAGRVQQRLAYIIRFRKHQRINRPQPGKLPPPSLQSATVIVMYGRRDDMVCHLCGERIEPITDAPVNVFDAAAQGNGYHRQIAQQLSMDHVTPVSKGGTDHPSNVRASHLSCNKSRGNRPLPEDVTDSVNDSLNDSPPPALPEGNGREGKVEEGNASSSSSDASDADPPPEDEDEVARACWAFAERKYDQQVTAGSRIGHRDNWLAATARGAQRDVREHLALHPDDSPEAVARFLLPDPKPAETKPEIPVAAQPPDYEPPDTGPDWDAGRAELERIKADREALRAGGTK